MTARPSARVEVITRHPDVVREVGDMLADSLQMAGAEVTRITDREPVATGAGVHVLVGLGPEFRSVPRRGGDTRVVLWALDPLPPPRLGAAARRGIRQGGLDTRLRLSDSAAGRTLRRLLPPRVKRGAWTAARRLAGGRSPLLSETDEPVDALFFRLRWIERRYAQGRVDEVIVTNGSSVAVLGERGVAAVRLPVGLHHTMGRDEGLTRDVDVAVIGGVSGDRASRLQAIGSGLERRGLRLTSAPPDCFGAERTAFLNRAKVVLNLQRYPWHPSLIRFVLATACGALVASEAPVANTEPFEAGVHFVAAPPGELPGVIENCLRDEGERRAIVDAARALVEGEVTMDAVARHILSSTATATR